MASAGGFSRSGSSSDDEIFSGINITPLVDVVLVLLIIFLITAPVLYQSAIKVQLPKAQSGDAQSKDQNLSFTVSKSGEIFWKNEKLSWDELGKKLSTLQESDREKPALINADRDTSHGTVVKLMDALRKAGIYRFALTVEQP